MEKRSGWSAYLDSLKGGANNSLLFLNNKSKTTRTVRDASSLNFNNPLDKFLLLVHESAKIGREKVDLIMTLAMIHMAAESKIHVQQIKIKEKQKFDN